MFRAPQGPQAPTVFYGTPTLDQVIQVVNANTSKVNQLQTTSASLSVTGVPALQCDIAMERPLRFRMTAGTRITGSELDLGSNDNLFWLWAKRNEQPAVYFARHNEFRNAAAAQIMPVPPSWIIDAIGLVQLAHDGSTTGPFPQGNGRLEVRSRTRTASGDLNRSIVLDDQRGHILEQRVFDNSGQLLATSVTSDHHYDSTTGVTLPRQIDIQLPPAQMAFTVTTAGYMINQLSGDGLQLWSMPQKDGVALVDLSRVSPGMQAGVPPQKAPNYPGALSDVPQNIGVTQASGTSPATGYVPPPIIRQQSSWRRQYGWW